MAALHDYKCEKHGYFESRKAECPMKGCTDTVHKVFLQAPGIKTERTKKADSTLKGLANDFGMTNLKSTREGEHQEGYFNRDNKMTSAQQQELADREQMAKNQQKEGRPGDAAIWGGGFKGLDMNSVLSGRFNQPIGPSLGKEAEQVGIMPSQAGNLTGPKPASYIADHENLSIKP